MLHHTNPAIAPSALKNQGLEGPHAEGHKQRRILTKVEQYSNLVYRYHICQHIRLIILGATFFWNTSPRSIIYRMKWNRTSVCLVIPWWTWFLSAWIELWLLQRTSTFYCATPESLTKPRSHKASLTASVTTIYIITVVDKALTLVT